MSQRDTHDTVVVKDGGSSTGMLLGVVAIILVVAAIWYFALGPGAGSQTNTNDGPTPTIKVDLPSVAPGAS